MSIANTSITLLKDIANDSGNARWSEFYHIYEQPIRGFLQAKFPSVEADDILQETMIALMRCLPSYRYVPDKNGHFHNYLMGIVKHKAEDALKRNKSEQRKRDGLRESFADTKQKESDAWKDAVMYAAVEQLLANDSINSRNREIFRCIALNHEPPQSVADRFGVTRNNVDQIKARLITRLTELVRAMSSAV